MTTENMVVDVSLDWVLACDVQRRFMQGLGRASDSLDYSGRCRQVRALGGDCYDFMPLANERLALVVGDASGKGVAAAFVWLSASAQTTSAEKPSITEKIGLPGHPLANYKPGTG